MRFLDIAFGSSSELETQLMLASKLGYLDENASCALLALRAEIERMLVALMRSLEARTR